MMAIKNYTTTIDVYKSMGEIQGAIAAHGARKVMIEYDEKGMPQGIAFAIDTPAGQRAFLLPANVEGVRAVFDKQHIQAKPEQPERTAWRNVRDWVMAQMAIIEAGQVEMEEVFFPYMTNRQGRTVYELYAKGQIMIGEQGE